MLSALAAKKLMDWATVGLEDAAGKRQETKRALCGLDSLPAIDATLSTLSVIQLLYATGKIP